MCSRRILGMGIIAFTLLLFLAGENLAAEKKFPTKPIQVIITFQPGDTDSLLRPFIDKMPEDIGQPMSFVFKPGAGGALGAAFAASAKPDGYTLVGSTQSAILVLPLTRKDLTYSLQSFVPICCLLESAMVMVVKTDAPWKTFRDFVADAKKNPGKISYTSSGTYAMPHLIGEALSKEAGMKLNYIPSQGAGPAVTAVLGGHVDAYSGSSTPAIPHIRAGTMRVIVAYGSARVPTFADIPTLTETGIPIAASAIYGLLAPKDTPKEVIETLHQAAKKAVENNRSYITERLDKLNAQILFESPEEYAAHLARDNKLFFGILKMVGSP